MPAPNRSKLLLETMDLECLLHQEQIKGKVHTKLNMHYHNHNLAILIIFPRCNFYYFTNI